MSERRRGPRVLVAPIGSGASRAVAQCLADDGARVVAAAPTIPPRWLRPPSWADAIRLPPNPADPVEAIETAARQSDAEALVLLTTPGVGLMALHRERLSRLAAPCAPSSEAFLATFDRRRLEAACLDAGVPIPRSLEIEEARRRLLVGEPVVVKPRFEIGGALGLSFCREEQDLEPALEACRRLAGEPIVQEYVPGSESGVLSAKVVLDRHSQPVAAFAFRKLRQWPPSGGITALGESICEPELIRLLVSLGERVGFTGLLNAEFKRDPRDGRARLLEVNPRPTATMGAALVVGVRLATLVVRAALGDSLPSAVREYRPGVRVVVPRVYLNVLRAQRREGASLTALARQAATELRGAHLMNPRAPLLRSTLARSVASASGGRRVQRAPGLAPDRARELLIAAALEAGGGA